MPCLALPDDGPGDPPDTMLTIEQVARLFSVSERYVQCLVRERRIPFHRFGTKVRFCAHDLNTYSYMALYDPDALGADQTDDLDDDKSTAVVIAS